MSSESAIRRGQSCAVDPRAAAAQFHEEVDQPETALVVFFASSAYDLDVLGAEIARSFAGVEVVGCTTAGEIGPLGYCRHSITGASFPASLVTVASGHFDRLQQFGTAEGQRLVQAVLQRLEAQGPGANAQSSFALLLIDGLSMREEPIAQALQRALGDVMMFGGSAGDDLTLASSHVYWDGAFHSDSGALIVISTPLPFKLFRTQHFVASDEILVVTEADPIRRIVREINGLPAAQEYARVIGVTPGALDSNRFAASPVTVLIHGGDYVRSIQKANAADGSLSFYCAIEEGVVLRVAHGIGLVENLEAAFARIRAEIGVPQFSLGCDCVLRNLEMTQHGLTEGVSKVFLENNLIGFSSYGEQISGVHVNQTLTGVAIGVPRESVR